MPAESFISYRGRKATVKDGFLSVFYLLVFNRVNKVYGNSSPPFNALKKELGNEALYMLVIQDVSLVEYDNYLGDIENEFMIIANDVLNELKHGQLTNEQISNWSSGIRNYLVQNGLNAFEPASYPEKIITNWQNPIPKENYIKAFELIIRFFKGELNEPNNYIW